jgi:predicted secreted protein|tara:strand:+ start:426 stop:839 length:414 start_codon:yes stop_codon:yes gene_type:complete
MYPAHMIKFCSVLACLFLFCCTSPQTTEDDTITRPFTPGDAQQAITIAPNRVFNIELQSNPTTGYEWSLTMNPEGIISRKSKNYTSSASGRVGVGGIMSWTLASKKIGATTLTFKYHRPWEKDVEPTREVVFNINVR